MFKYGSLFLNILETLLGYIYLTLVWLVFCLPIVTIGASTSAFYRTTRKYLIQKEGHLLPTFWQSFKLNFRQSTILWLLVAGVGFAVWQGMRAMALLSDSTWSSILQGLQVVALVILGLILLYGLPMLTRFDNKLLRIISNSLALGIRHLGNTIIILLLIAGGALICWLIPVFIIIIPSVLMMFWAIWLEKIFALYLVEEQP